MYRVIVFCTAVCASFIFFMFGLSSSVLDELFQGAREENPNGSAYSVVEKCDSGLYSNAKDYVKHKCNENP